MKPKNKSTIIKVNVVLEEHNTDYGSNPIILEVSDKFVGLIDLGQSRTKTVVMLREVREKVLERFDELFEQLETIADEKE